MIKGRGLKPELLAPAGDLEKLQFACLYGADAVYIGGKEFSLRAGAGNFSLTEIKAAVSLAHSLGKKVYLAVNIFANNRDIVHLPDFLRSAAVLGVDAFLISDPGVFRLARQYAPQVPIHISTQANNTNWQSALFWREQGAKRIVLARELSLAEAAEIKTRSGLETEIFIHGAICISYSGRCYLSSYFLSRDANRGDCAQPCRWQYRLEEAERPNTWLPLEEDEKGCYILNSKDLSLLPILPRVLGSKATAWKIEGRNKSAYYVANVTRIYRQALDAAWNGNWQPRQEWQEELAKVSHREYTTSFALADPTDEDYRYEDASYLRGWDFAAIAKKFRGKELLLEQRNHLEVGDEAEIILADGRNLPLKLDYLRDEEGRHLKTAPHPMQKVWVPCRETFPLPAIVRRLVKGGG